MQSYEATRGHETVVFIFFNCLPRIFDHVYLTRQRSQRFVDFLSSFPRRIAIAAHYCTRSSLCPINQVKVTIWIRVYATLIREAQIFRHHWTMKASMVLLKVSFTHIFQYQCLYHSSLYSRNKSINQSVHHWFHFTIKARKTISRAELKLNGKS